MTKSRVFLYLCLSFILGVFISSFFTVNFVAVGGILILALVLISIWWKYKKAIATGFFLLFFIFGILRHQQAATRNNKSQQDKISFYNEEIIEFEGVIGEYPQESLEKTQIIVRVNTVNGIKSSGNILVFIAKYPERKYGDRLNIECEIKEPGEIEEFSYKNYLAKSDIYSVCYRPKKLELISEGNGNKIYSIVLKIKDSFNSVIKRIFPEPCAALLQALLLGEKNGLSQSIKDNFATAGVSHIIAISGYHVAVIAGFLSLVLASLNLSRRKSFWLTISFILFFVFLTGAAASVVRAGIMGSILLVATSLGRISKAKNVIVFAGFLMLVFNPLLLRFDMGFLLSFGATLGIVYFFPIMEKILVKVPEKLGLRSILAMSFAAQLAVLPIAVFNFDKLSLVAPLANLLIIPCVPLTMFFGFVAILCGFASIILGKIFGFVAWGFLFYMIKTVEILAKAPFSSVEIKFFNWGWAIGYYVLLIGLYLFFNAKVKNQNAKIQIKN